MGSGYQGKQVEGTLTYLLCCTEVEMVTVQNNSFMFQEILDIREETQQAFTPHATLDQLTPDQQQLVLDVEQQLAIGLN